MLNQKWAINSFFSFIMFNGFTANEFIGGQAVEFEEKF